MTKNKEFQFNYYLNNYLTLNRNKILTMNLILIRENFQEKVDMEKLLNVKVIMIKNFMLLKY